MSAYISPAPPEIDEDFRNFLYLIWKHLGLPDPTPTQYDIAEFIQWGPDREVIEAFRGVGKSFITAAFVLWCLLKNPQLKIMVVSATERRAQDFTTFLLQLISTVPLLQHLEPDEDARQRASIFRFDVRPATPDQSPSVKSVGITGQITGSRADIIIADDIEIPKNTATEGQRDKLQEAVKEFSAILKPGGRIIYLGTPQCEMSLYNILASRGYTIRVWPAEYPAQDKVAFYGDRLAGFVRDAIVRNPRIVGQPTEPRRFPKEELLARLGEYGRSGYDLQFMLDTRLSDLHRFPLRLSDLIVMSCNPTSAPEKPIWCADPRTVVNDLPTLGLPGDRFHRPMEFAGSWIPYTGAVMAIDPSGRGKDELAWCVLKFLNGFLYLLDIGGSLSGYDEKSLKAVVASAKAHQVQAVIHESNFGDGMFGSILGPYFEREYPVHIEEVKNSKQKELRIIDTLEPVLTQHRLVVDEKVIRQDLDLCDRIDSDSSNQYSLFWQMARITRERGCLVRDDRLDVLAIGVNYWAEKMNRDVEKSMANRKSKLLDDELKQIARSYGIRWGNRKGPTFCRPHTRN